MCGIVGIADAHNATTAGERKRLCMAALDELKHRGPEGARVENLGPITLGHCQLAFQDINNGLQPVSADGVTVVLNGEIYNHFDLRKSIDAPFETQSDAETLLKLYLKFGIAGLHKLQGMYAAGWAKSHCFMGYATSKYTLHLSYRA